MSWSQLPIGGVAFILRCVPTPQERHRHRKNGGGFKSPRQMANEAELDLLLARFAPDKPLDGGFGLEFTACMPVPKSVSKKVRMDMLCGLIGHTKKQDLDNLEKQLKDAMTRTGFWYDDSQVVKSNSHKIYFPEPQWEVRIWRECREWPVRKKNDSEG